MKKIKRSGWAVIYATNGNKKPSVTIDSVHKSKSEAEQKLKWLNPQNNNYSIIPAPLIDLVKEETNGR